MRSAARSGSSRTTSLDALGRLTPPRAGHRRRRLPLPRHAHRRRRSPTPPPTSPNGRNDPRRRSRPCSTSSAAARAAASSAPCPAADERTRAYELFHDVLAEPILDLAQRVRAGARAPAAFAGSFASGASAVTRRCLRRARHLGARPAQRGETRCRAPRRRSRSPRNRARNSPPMSTRSLLLALAAYATSPTTEAASA